MRVEIEQRRRGEACGDLRQQHAAVAQQAMHVGGHLARRHAMERRVDLDCGHDGEVLRRPACGSTEKRAGFDEVLQAEPIT